MGVAAKSAEGLRVAVVVPNLSVGGAQAAMLALAAGLAARGAAVDLVILTTLGERHGLAPPALPEGRVTRIGAQRIRGAVRPLARHLSAQAPDAVVSVMPATNLAVVAALALGAPRPRPRPRLVLVEQNRPDRPRPPGSLLRAAARRAYARADAVVACSEGVAEAVARIVARPVSVIRNPVVGEDLAARMAGPLLPNELAHWAGPGAPPLVLGVGRLTAQKDFATLIDAAARLRARRPCRLLILGEGEDRGMLEARAWAAGFTLGPEGDAALPGTVADPYPWYARAGVFALSSRWEGLGNVIVEAMACGAPVVVTDCPSGPAEIVALAGGGALVPVGDADALAAALESALEAPGPRAYALAEFSHGRVVDEYLTVLAGP